MNPRLLARAIRAHLTLPILGQLPTIQIDGNILDAASAKAYLTAVALQAAPNQVPIAYSAVTNATTAALTLTPANCAEGLINAIVVPSGGSANTNTTDTATAIINGYWPNAYVGSVALLTIVNLNSGTNTLAGGTGVTISGTATIPTLALAAYRAKVTNLAAVPGVLGSSQALQPGVAATNTTTTSAAVTNNAGQANPTSVINVASATGIINVAGASWLGVVNTDGTTSYYAVSSVASTAITVVGNINKNIASGAAVSVYNNAITFTRLYSTVTAIMAA